MTERLIDGHDPEQYRSWYRSLKEAIGTLFSIGELDLAQELCAVRKDMEDKLDEYEIAMFNERKRIHEHI